MSRGKIDGRIRDFKDCHLDEIPRTVERFQTLHLFLIHIQSSLPLLPTPLSHRQSIPSPLVPIYTLNILKTGVKEGDGKLTYEVVAG